MQRYGKSMKSTNRKSVNEVIFPMSGGYFTVKLRKIYPHSHIHSNPLCYFCSPFFSQTTLRSYAVMESWLFKPFVRFPTFRIKKSCKDDTLLTADAAKRIENRRSQIGGNALNICNNRAAMTLDVAIKCHRCAIITSTLLSTANFAALVCG